MNELRALAPRALRFGVVGFAGFVIDTAVVYAARGRLGLYGAGMLSYVIAASCNYGLNRSWTFRDRPRLPIARQWLLFLAATLPGLLFNRGAYVLLIALVPFCTRHPILAIVAGSLTGMVANFVMSHRVVFAPAKLLVD